MAELDELCVRVLEVQKKAHELDCFWFSTRIHNLLGEIEIELIKIRNERNRCINGCPHFETSAKGDPYPFERCNKYSTNKHARPLSDCKMICDYEHENTDGVE